MACPIAFREIDGTVVRLNAVSVALLVTLFLMTANVFFLFLLSADFLIRLYGNKKLSPVQQLSLGVQRLFSLQKHMTDAGAKRLAGHFGLLFSVLLILAHYFEWAMFGYAVSAIFLVCIFLEVAFNYCVGCKIYFVLKKIYPEIPL